MEINERNESVRRIVEGVKNTPTFSVGDVVTASEIGGLMDLFEPDLQMVVAATGDIIGKWCGDPSRTVETWSFGEDGKVTRQAVDPRFLKLAE